MTKFLRSVNITLINGNSVTFEDTDVYQGGTIAWDQVKQGANVKAPLANGDAIAFIPFHAIAFAEATRNTAEEEAPIDEFCLGGVTAEPEPGV